MILAFAFATGLIVSFASGWLAASSLWRSRLRGALQVAKSYRQLMYAAQGIRGPEARAQARMDTELAGGGDE